MWDSDVIILNISMAHNVPVGTVYVVGWCISRKQKYFISNETS